MRILIMHSQYLSGAVSGENRVVEDEKALLEQGGHEVRAWMPSPEGVGGLALVRLAASTVWSRDAVAELNKLIDGFSPDIIHCHNMFPSLSPAVLSVGRKRGIPTMVTLHNYRLLCLPGTFVRDGRICEDCLGKQPWRGVVHRCHRDSVAASGALATSIGFHRAKSTFDLPVFYLAVSEFLRAKHVEGGFDPDQVIVKPNFAWPATKRVGPGEHFLYLGRLAPEKGVSTLMRAWKDVQAPLLIVGDGPEMDELRAGAPSHVEFTGPIPGSEVPKMLAGARALVVPSTWYEGAPRGIIEAFAAGVPVLASSIGGLAELIAEGSNGSLVTPGDPTAWAAAARRLQDDELSLAWGAGAFHTWEERFTPEVGLKNLEAVYRAALARANDPVGSTG
jgi:glycosyltransferase involved in cell wall biosynthesis